MSTLLMQNLERTFGKWNRIAEPGITSWMSQILGDRIESRMPQLIAEPQNFVPK